MMYRLGRCVIVPAFAFGLAVSGPMAADSFAQVPAPVQVPGPAPSIAAPPLRQDQPLLPANETAVRVAAEVGPSVVTFQPGLRTDRLLAPETGFGSGFIFDVINDQAYIVTNYHVVAAIGSRTFTVFIADGTGFRGEVVATDRFFDLAVVRANIPPDRRRVARLGNSDGIRVGEQTIAIGNPWGLEGTVTTGIVSARRSIVPGVRQTYVNLIQTDAAINNGNSGGPLLNAQGDVIGVNSLSQVPDVRIQNGLNFAIPINNVKLVLPDLVAGRPFPHPDPSADIAAYVEVTPELAQDLGLLTSEGLLIDSVKPGGNADRAGLRGGSEIWVEHFTGEEIAVGGDIVIAVDHQPIRRGQEFLAHIFSHKRAGDNVTMTVVRSGEREPRDIQVPLSALPMMDEQ